MVLIDGYDDLQYFRLVPVKSITSLMIMLVQKNDTIITKQSKTTKDWEIVDSPRPIEKKNKRKLELNHNARNYNKSPY